LPPDLLAVARRFQRRSAAGNRGETLNRVRGRYVKSAPGQIGDGKIAIDATLRAAAPLQALRQREGAQRRISITMDDLRFKRFKQKAGMLFIFAVDASGSMALNRMREAKGALARLLKAAYLHRDKVALVSFRGQQAEVLLPPSQSVERAKRSLDALPVGGGTPLAAGLLAALDLAKRAQRSGIRQTMLVLFTDGRANVSGKADTGESASSKQMIQQELKQVGAALQREAIASVIIDTQAHFTSRGEGRALAELLGGRYVYLPQASSAEVYETVAATAAEIRS
jgi:magnesium chelatase subunit D